MWKPLCLPLYGGVLSLYFYSYSYSYSTWHGMAGQRTSHSLS
jgi:hypothetical protein